MNPDILQNFERSFASLTCGCVRTCQCGRVFYDDCNEGYTWDDGEFEALVNDPKATGLDYAVETIQFDGREYVSDCDCWRKRAETIINFLLGHKAGIAKFLSLEKQRLRDLADLSPTVEP